MKNSVQQQQRNIQFSQNKRNGDDCLLVSGVGMQHEVWKYTVFVGQSCNNELAYVILWHRKDEQTNLFEFPNGVRLILDNFGLNSYRFIGTLKQICDRNEIIHC